MGGKRGSVLLEAAIGGLVFVGSLALSLEWVRRSYCELLLHHGSFLAARSAVFSGASAGERRAQAFWRRAWPALRARASVDWYPDHVSARAHAEYEAWWRFRVERGIKRRFEVTRRCRFYFSR